MDLLIGSKAWSVRDGVSISINSSTNESLTENVCHLAVEIGGRTSGWKHFRNLPEANSQYLTYISLGFKTTFSGTSHQMVHSCRAK